MKLLTLTGTFCLGVITTQLFGIGFALIIAGVLIFGAALTSLPKSPTKRDNDYFGGE